MDLEEGRHEYKFFVDGQWLHDPNEVSVQMPLQVQNMIAFNSSHARTMVWEAGIMLLMWRKAILTLTLSLGR